MARVSQILIECFSCASGWEDKGGGRICRDVWCRSSRGSACCASFPARAAPPPQLSRTWRQPTCVSVPPLRPCSHCCGDCRCSGAHPGRESAHGARRCITSMPASCSACQAGSHCRLPPAFNREALMVRLGPPRPPLPRQAASSAIASVACACQAAVAASTASAISSNIAVASVTGARQTDQKEARQSGVGRGTCNHAVGSALHRLPSHLRRTAFASPCLQCLPPPAPAAAPPPRPPLPARRRPPLWCVADGSCWVLTAAVLLTPSLLPPSALSSCELACTHRAPP